MCRIYNNIGSLSSLKSHLENSNIHDFKSLKEVMDFQNSYSDIRQQLISHHENLIQQEKNILEIELQELEAAIQTLKHKSEQRLLEEIGILKQNLSVSINSKPTNYFQKIIKDFRHRSDKRKINNKEQNFEIEVKMAISELVGNYHFKNNRYQFTSSHISEAVRQSALQPLLELERKKAKIDELNSFIYGALGVQKVVRTLETLSDEYFLINDFTISFSSAIYNKQENDYIKSIQIDHILVAPSGIFLIETKNWSERSLENLSLHSPVQQIRRTNFALYRILNSGLSNSHLLLDPHHWGNKKISIRNLIVLINTRPKEEFQHVKILTLTELLGYIQYFKPIFSNFETQKIAEFLINVNNHN